MKKMKFVAMALMLCATVLSSWSTPAQFSEGPQPTAVPANENAELAPPECYTQEHLNQFMSCYGICTPSPCLTRWDLNGDGCVNVADLLLLLARMC